jgi:hypothetical protein
VDPQKMSLPTDEKMKIQFEYTWESIAGALSLNSIKATFLSVFTLWYYKFRTVYEVKIASLIFAIWLVRFSFGTVQAINRREWTSAQCKAGLKEMAGFCAVAIVVWTASQIIGIQWILGTWLGCWLMAEVAALSSKIIVFLPNESPLTKLVSAFIYFFHGRIDNMSQLMRRLGRNPDKADEESPEVSENTQKKLDEIQAHKDDEKKSKIINKEEKGE